MKTTGFKISKPKMASKQSNGMPKHYNLFMLKLIPQQICPQQQWVTGDICAKTLCKDTETETADLPSRPLGTGLDFKISVGHMAVGHFTLLQHYSRVSLLFYRFNQLYIPDVGMVLRLGNNRSNCICIQH